MDTRTGALYSSLDEALLAGVPDQHLVEIRGDAATVAELASSVAAQRSTERRRAVNKRARAARRKNRTR